MIKFLFQMCKCGHAEFHHGPYNHHPEFLEVFPDLEETCLAYINVTANVVENTIDVCGCPKFRRSFFWWWKK